MDPTPLVLFAIVSVSTLVAQFPDLGPLPFPPPPIAPSESGPLPDLSQLTLVKSRIEQLSNEGEPQVHILALLEGNNIRAQLMMRMPIHSIDDLITQGQFEFNSTNREASALVVFLTTAPFQTMSPYEAMEVTVTVDEGTQGHVSVGVSGTVGRPVFLPVDPNQPVEDYEFHLDPAGTLSISDLSIEKLDPSGPPAAPWGPPTAELRLEGGMEFPPGPELMGPGMIGPGGMGPGAAEGLDPRGSPLMPDMPALPPGFLPPSGATSISPPGFPPPEFPPGSSFPPPPSGLEGYPEGVPITPNSRGSTDEGPMENPELPLLGNP